MISVVIISKDEASIDATLGDITAQAISLNQPSEVVVVDASSGRLDHIRDRHEKNVRWIKFVQPPGVTISIPHQRNAGVQVALGDIIVFTDAGCRPEPEWLKSLVAPLYSGESVTVGLTLASPDSTNLYDRGALQAMRSRYLKECSTINLAFRREVFDVVGGFDEEFAYGSDIDFSWRLNAVGYQIRTVPEAVIRHDWGSRRRQLRRSYVYGRARIRLYRRHQVRFAQVVRNDPMVIAYPMFLIGLPLTAVCPLYPALLIIPAWRNRANGIFRVLADHLVYGAGVLRELVRP